jgi:hypothetical protein
MNHKPGGSTGHNLNHVTKNKPRPCQWAAYFFVSLFDLSISETISNPKVNATINASKTVIQPSSFQLDFATLPSEVRPNTARSL